MQHFTMKAEHLILLRHSSVSWPDCGFGAPRIDPKRPYGNGDVVGDMAKMLGVEPVPTDDEETHWPPGTTERMGALHRQLETALQVVLATGEFRLGEYECDDCKRDWKRKD